MSVGGIPSEGISAGSSSGGISSTGVPTLRLVTTRGKNPPLGPPPALSLASRPDVCLNRRINDSNSLMLLGAGMSFRPVTIIFCKTAANAAWNCSAVASLAIVCSWENSVGDNAGLMSIGITSPSLDLLAASLDATSSSVGLPLGLTNMIRLPELSVGIPCLEGVGGAACLGGAVFGGVFFAMAGYCYHGLREGVKGFVIWRFGIFRVRDFFNWPHRARLLGAAGRWGVTGGGCHAGATEAPDRAPRLHRACLRVRKSLEECGMLAL